MRFHLKALLGIFSCLVPAVAQTTPQNSLTINCHSNLPGPRYFCWQYRMKQAAEWEKLAKQPADKAELIVQLDKFAKNKVVVEVSIELGGMSLKSRLNVSIDSRHPTDSALRVADAVTSCLNLWTSQKKR